MRALSSSPFLWSSLVLAIAAGCGGNVVFVDEEGGGGTGERPPATGSTTQTTSSVSSTSAQTTTSTVTTGPEPTGENLVELPQGSGIQEGTFSAQAEPGTLGLTFVATTQSQFAQVSVTRQGAPSGATVIGPVVPSNAYEYTWFGAIAQGTPQVSHPETFPLAQGTWTFDAQADAPMTATIWRRQTNDGAFHGGVLDVNVFIPGGFLSEDIVLAQLQAAYGDWAGITLGEVRFFPVGAGYLTVDENNIFDYTEETAVAPSRPSLNLMLTSAIEGQFSGAAGFSLGAPGAPTEPGSTMAGVVWMWIGDGFFDTIILRHEAGHFAGLFHTSEFEPGLGDSLTDTPFCDDVMSIFSACPDFDNIMFPTGGSGAQLFSPLQEKVIQGSTIYRGIYASGEAPMPPFITLDGPRREHGGAELADKAWILEAPRASHDGAWRERLAPEVALHLGGLGCPTGATNDYYDTLAAAGGNDVAALFDVASDPSAPTYVRRRAAGMLARLSPRSPGVRAYLAALAADENEPSVLRGGALRSLHEIAPERARAAAARIDPRDDRVVEQAVAAARR